ncbi:hypothetical protein U1Q18_021074 [Sarracenia purpurea var. burkii]
MSSMNAHSGLASSIIIELYQPRPALEVIEAKLGQPFGGEYQKESSIGLGNEAQKPQPIMFQKLEISKPNQLIFSGTFTVAPRLHGQPTSPSPSRHASFSLARSAYLL